MTEKRYKVHNIIKGMDVGESVDLELMKKLIEEYGAYENMNVEIMNNGKKMTYKEVVDLLNENEQLKKDIKFSDRKQNDFFKNWNDCVNENFRLKQENEQLKEKNKQLRHDLNALRRGGFGGF